MVQKLELIREEKLYRLLPGKKKQQPEVCARKDQSIHIFRIPATDS